MKYPFNISILVFILCYISRLSNASVFSDSTLTCGGKYVTISIPQSYLNDTLGLRTGDSVRVAADNECRTERVESPSTETHCQLQMAGGNYEATFPNTDCDVTEEKTDDGLFYYYYTIVKSTSSSIRRHQCQDITFTCLVYSTNDTVTGDSYSITDVDQTAQREQTQQVELRAGFMKNTISYSPIFSFTVFKNPPALKVGWYYQFYIFFAPNNASSETWFYDGDGNMPTENSTLYLGACEISNPDDTTEIVQLTDDNGDKVSDQLLMGIKSSSVIIMALKIFAWSSGVHTSQELTCQVRLCTSDCPAPSTRTSRKKRDLGDIENVKTFEISTNWEITTDRDENYIN